MPLHMPDLIPIQLPPSILNPIPSVMQIQPYLVIPMKENARIMLSLQAIKWPRYRPFQLLIPNVLPDPLGISDQQRHIWPRADPVWQSGRCISHEARHFDKGGSWLEHCGVGDRDCCYLFFGSYYWAHMNLASIEAVSIRISRPHVSLQFLPVQFFHLWRWSRLNSRLTFSPFTKPFQLLRSQLEIFKVVRCLGCFFVLAGDALALRNWLLLLLFSLQLDFLQLLLRLFGNLPLQ